MKRRTLIVTAFFLFVHSTWPEERKVSEFDADLARIGELLELIQTAAEEGATKIEFPEGEWNWHVPGRAGLPKKDRFASEAFQAGGGLAAKVLRERIEQWIRKNGVKGVIVSMDAKLPAKRFFEVERVLRLEGVVYWVATEGKPTAGTLSLHETDGIVQIIPLEREAKGEERAFEPVRKR